MKYDPAAVANAMEHLIANASPLNGEDLHRVAQGLNYLNHYAHSSDKQTAARARTEMLRGTLVEIIGNGLSRGVLPNLANSEPGIKDALLSIAQAQQFSSENARGDEAGAQILRLLIMGGYDVSDFKSDKILADKLKDYFDVNRNAGQAQFFSRGLNLYCYGRMASSAMPEVETTDKCKSDFAAAQKKSGMTQVGTETEKVLADGENGIFLSHQNYVSLGNPVGALNAIQNSAASKTPAPSINNNLQKNSPGPAAASAGTRKSPAAKKASSIQK